MEGRSMSFVLSVLLGVIASVVIIVIAGGGEDE